MRIVCILANGVGNRFGSSLPKQYHLINGRPALEYTVVAALKSNADEVIVVTNPMYMRKLENLYGVVCVEGGNERNISLANALDYIDEHYNCHELMVIDAVCPLVTPDLMNLYFDYLHEYEAVFTTAKIPTSLARYDGAKVKREEYFLIQSPDAYRFPLLRNNFNRDTEYTTPLHCLPLGTNIKYYFGFKNYAKIIYPHDIAIIESLLNEAEKKIHFSSHKSDDLLRFFAKIRQTDRKVIRKWERDIDDIVDRLFSRWQIYEYNVNSDAYTGIVLECNSRQYGPVVVKMYPPTLKERYRKERYILQTLKNYHQCELLATDDDSYAMLIQRIVPGDYIDFRYDKNVISELWGDLARHKQSARGIEVIPEIKGIIQQMEDEWSVACKYPYHCRLMNFLVESAKKCYEENFAYEEKYILHGDIYFKNALKDDKGITTIDPVGYCDAFIFEFMPFFTYELVLHANGDYMGMYSKLQEMFLPYAESKQLKAAVYVFMVKQLVPSIYEANDGYSRADGYMQAIMNLYADDYDELKIIAK